VAEVGDVGVHLQYLRFGVAQAQLDAEQHLLGFRPRP
jgi:hypothetical protein